MAMGATMPETPQRMLQRVPEIWRWRDNPASIVLLGAARHPTRTAIIDDDAEVSFGQLQKLPTGATVIGVTVWFPGVATYAIDPSGANAIPCGAVATEIGVPTVAVRMSGTPGTRRGCRRVDVERAIAERLLKDVI